MKKIVSIVALALALFTLAACGSSPSAAPTASPASASPASESPAANSPDAPVEKTKVSFYGLILEYAPSQGMVDRMKEKLGDKYDYEIIPVDWGNLENVISTGIASNAPCDVYTYWPAAMTTFKNNGQVLDLTPYLEANSNEWKNTFVPAQLDVGLIDGKYWSVPLDATYQMAIVNKQIFADAGVEIKETWTWDEFMDACEKIKATGKFPFALWRDGVDWLWKNYMASTLLSESQEKFDSFVSHDLTKDDPSLSGLLDLAKNLSDKGYWYPGVGGVNSARDEARASFVKGDTAILFEMASLYASIDEECEFDIAPVCWPKNGSVTVNMGGTDGYFIPSNAKNVDGAVESLKVILDAESQALLPAASIIPSNASVQIEDPTLQKLAELSGFMQSRLPGSQELQTYLKQGFIPEYVLGTSKKDDCLNEYESLREMAKAAQ